jgi:hypothetical protein
MVIDADHLPEGGLHSSGVIHHVPHVQPHAGSRHQGAVEVGSEILSQDNKVLVVKERGVIYALIVSLEIPLPVPDRNRFLEW